MVQPHPWLVYLFLKSPRGETHASENCLSQRQHVTAYAVPWTHEELWLEPTLHTEQRNLNNVQYKT